MGGNDSRAVASALADEGAARWRQPAVQHLGGLLGGKK
jgi:hypothetical protein